MGRFGASGPFSEFTQAAVTIDFGSQSANSAADNAVSVTGSKAGDYWVAVPQGTWNAGLTLPEGRCLVDGTVQFRIANVTAGALDPASQSFNLFGWRPLST